MKQSILNTAHSITCTEILKLAGVKPTEGLGTKEVQKFEKQFGVNTLPKGEEKSLYKSIFAQLKNPLALVLLLALFLTIILGEYIDSFVILLATVINIYISLNQESSAFEAFGALAGNRTHTAAIIRDGMKQIIDSTKLVPGDIVFLSAGDYVPADGRVIKDNHLGVNQVSFTGESNGIAKSIKKTNEKNVFARSSMVYMGSTVSGGSGTMLVTAIGEKTELGSIASELGSIKKDLSPVQEHMKAIALFLGVATVLIVVFVVLLGYVQGVGVIALLILAIALAVSAIPEGLLAAVTVVLAYGARNIMKEGGLVKNLSSAETLGSATFILTDKTGTLTHGRMSTDDYVTLNDTKNEQTELHEVTQGAIDVFFDEKKEKYIGDEMDTAIAKNSFAYHTDFTSYNKFWPQAASIPFDSAYKFFASLRGEGKKKKLFVKGATEVLVAECVYAFKNGKVVKFTAKDKKEVLNRVDKFAEEGKRVLAFAAREKVDEEDLQTAYDSEGYASVPGNLVYYGFVTFTDKVRASVKEVITKIREDGTRVVMITGDASITAHTVALKSGLISDKKEAVYEGAEIDAMSDQELYAVLQSGVAKVFARVTPAHKLRLATLLQERGEVVAMTGDGVNDAPALQKATIGISLSSSTEVAKEAADLVLVNDSFSTIAFAINEGKRMGENLKKTVIYLLSTSFTEVIVLLGSFLVAGPVPFYATQILWANILEEGLMNFAFIFEPNHGGKNSEHEGVMGAHTKRLIFTIGAFNGILLLGFYFGLLYLDFTGDLLRTYMFAALSIDSIFFGVALKSLYKPTWSVALLSNKYLVIVSTLSFALLVLALNVPFLMKLLHLESITLFGFGVIFLFGVVNLLAVEAAKKLCR